MSSSQDWPASHTGMPANPVSEAQRVNPATESAVSRLERARALLRDVSAGVSINPTHVSAPARATEEGSSPANADTDDIHDRARNICFNQLNHSARSRAQLAAALTKRAIPEDVAEAVLDRLEQVGLIDDAEFARAWVRSRQRSKGLSRRLLASELHRAGVAQDLINDALAEVDDEDETAAAYALAAKRARALSTVPPDVAMRRIAALLARKGYAPNVCFAVAKAAVHEPPSLL